MLMKKIKLFLVCLLAVVSAAAFAQNRTVKGQVTSADDGLPIIGASVFVQGTNLGTVTDSEGYYTLKNVPANAANLVVSYIGMKDMNKPIADVVDFVMGSDTEQLNEVVVTALGIKRSEKALGFAATAVKGDDLAKSRSADIMSGIQGKVAGVSISSTSSDPGSSQSVIIRGVSSLSGSNQPLYVIDGVPMNNSAIYSSNGLDNGYDFGNGAGAVNPDDVESMTILKGAAATALYGSRAASGVILINTKSGKKQARGLGIEYNGGIQLETILRVPQMQNIFGMGWYGEKTEIENGSWGPIMDGAMALYGNVYQNSQKMKSFSPLPDNIKDFFDTGFRYSNSVSFNGATDASDYFVSISQISDDGMIPTNKDSYDKYTFSARGSHKIGNLTFSSSLNYAYQKNSFVSTGQGKGSMYNSIMQTPRDISIIGLKDLDDPFNMPGYYYTPYGVTNPYYLLKYNKNEYEADRFYGKFQADYKLFKYFNLTYRIGLDTSAGNHASGEPNMKALFKDTPNYDGNLDAMTGSATQQTTRRREINQDLYLTFSKDIKDFSINAVAGVNYNDQRNSYVSAGVTNLTIPTYYSITNSAEIPTVEQYERHKRLYGAYGQAEFGYKNLAFITVTARNDWSSTLPKGNRAFFYPGVTGSFVFSELFNEDVKSVIDFGKIRAAWGKTGSDAAPYMVQSVYAQASANSSGWGGSSFPLNKIGANAYSAGNVLGSEDLSPEMTTEAELGLNLAFFKNRFGIDFAWYNRNTDKQIFSLDMDPATGFTAQNINLGKVRNRGIELLVNATPVEIGDFRWDVAWNFTKNWSKVIDLPDQLGNETAIFAFTGGTGLYAIEGEEMGVYKAYVPLKDSEGHIVVNESDGLPVQDPTQRIVGSMNYKYTMGFNTTFTYKGLSLSADIDVRQGGKMFSRTKDILYFTGNAIQTAYNDRNPFIIPGSINATPKYNDDGSYTLEDIKENTTALDATNIFSYWDGGADELDSAFLIDKSYVKLRQVVLGWELPKKWFDNTPIRGLKISFYGNNLFVWTPKSNTFVDPELSSFGNDLEGQFGEYSANPSSRRFGFNLNVKF